MKKLNHNTMIRGIILTATLGMTLMMSACGGNKNITLYGTEEEYGKVTLGEYKGIAAEKKVYEISDEAIDSEIEYMLYDYIEYASVNRGAQDDDFITLKMKSSADGTTLYDSSEEESGVYETQLGYEDFGAEFDEQLSGAKKGDHLTFSVEYDQDFGLEDYAGKKVDFDVTVEEVSEEKVPELNDSFIKEKLGFDNEAALRQNVKDDLTAQYEENSNYSLYSDLIAKVVENSTIENYSDKLYESCYSSTEQNYFSYMEMLGCSTLEEVYAAFGITEDDIKQETIEMVNQQVVVNAIAQAENMEMTKADFDKRIEELAEEYEYDSVKELTEDVGEDYLKYMIMEEKVYKLLADNASLTEIKVDPSEEDGQYEDDAVEDDDILLEDEDAEEIDFIDDEMSDEDAEEIETDDADVEEEDVESDDTVEDDDEEVLEDDGDDVEEEDVEVDDDSEPDDTDEAEGEDSPEEAE